MSVCLHHNHCSDALKNLQFAAPTSLLQHFTWLTRHRRQQKHNSNNNVVSKQRTSMPQQPNTYSIFLITAITGTRVGCQETRWHFADVSYICMCMCIYMCVCVRQQYCLPQAARANNEFLKIPAHTHIHNFHI